MCVCKVCVCFLCFCDLYVRLVFLRFEKKHQLSVVNLGRKNVDITLVLTWFSETCVCSQMHCLKDFFEKLKGKKHTWAKHMS